MNTSQNYSAPADGASLPQLITHLQNVQLLFEHLPAGHYAFQRSIEEMRLRVAEAIGHLDGDILEAIAYSSTPTGQTDAQ